MRYLFPRISRTFIRFPIIIILIGLGMGCQNYKESPVDPIESQTKITLNKANRRVMEVMHIQNQHSQKFMSIPGVIGTATGLTKDGEIAIRIFAAEPGISGIPKKVSGVPIDIKVTGYFKPLSNPTVRFPRPVPIGISTGHPDVTAGTIGCRVKDNQGNVYALSNNHVYANSNDCSIGDNVLQPGAYDGGQEPDDILGQLFDFEPILFDGSINTIDAAIVLSASDSLGIATPSDGYGIPDSITVAAFIGQKVQKYGRTTGWTHGEVSEINVTVNVCYECGDPFCWTCSKQATFTDQIAITPGDFSDGGDSGSLVVTDDGNKNPVGLLFAGSPARTLINPIDPVLQRFNVSIDAGNFGSNSPPDADFSFTISNLTLTFTDQSTDSDGSILQWNWEFGNGATSTDRNPIHTYSTQGTYSVTLTVTDDDGANGSVSKNITLDDSGGNNPPVANFTYSINELIISFTDQSSDSGGTIIAWNWDFGDGQTSPVKNPLHIYSDPGTYMVTLTVTDNDLETNSFSQEIVLNEASNEPPIGSFTHTVSDLTVSFTDQSIDPDGTIIAWNWNFGNGQTSSIKNPIHIYTVDGTYTVMLTVTDNDGANHSVSQQITVNGSTNSPPTANFTFMTSGPLVFFTDQSSDSDGTIISWHWNFGDGSSSPITSPLHFYPNSGTYSVTLTVTDNMLATHSLTQEVTIN